MGSLFGRESAEDWPARQQAGSALQRGGQPGRNAPIMGRAGPYHTPVQMLRDSIVTAPGSMGLWINCKKNMQAHIAVYALITSK